MHIKSTFQAFLILSLAPAGWGQDFCHNRHRWIILPATALAWRRRAICGSFPMGRRADFMVAFDMVPAYVTLMLNDVRLSRGFEIDVQVPTELSPGNNSAVISSQGGRDGAVSRYDCSPRSSVTARRIFDSPAHQWQHPTGNPNGTPFATGQVRPMAAAWFTARRRRPPSPSSVSRQSAVLRNRTRGFAGL